jgi:DNA-directed RNA polymerases I, II, and III subunit RPABC1
MSTGGLPPHASRLFRVRKTCMKMLQTRGYIVNEDEITMSTDDWRAKFGEDTGRDKLMILTEKIDDPSDQLFVFFPDEDKVGVGPIKTYCSRMKEQNITRAIIVIKSDLTHFAKQAIRELASRGYKVEYFKDAELLVDITEHKLVPQHIVLSPQEKKELLARYRLKPGQLPRIQVIDPVARYFGLAPKQVVKIVRPSETAGRYITYRICV